MPPMKRTAPPPPIGSSQVLLWLPVPQVEPLACWWGCQVSVRPKWHMRNLCYDEPSGGRRSYRDTKGTLAGMTRSRTHGGPFSRSLHALNDSPRAPQQDGIASPPIMPLVPMWHDFDQPWPVAGKRHLVSLFRVPRRAPKPARIGANSATRRPQLMATATSMCERMLQHRSRYQVQASRL
jgi:hypothetical protein